jgi:hypothetical protein
MIMPKKNIAPDARETIIIFSKSPRRVGINAKAIVTEMPMNKIPPRIARILLQLLISPPFFLLIDSFKKTLSSKNYPLKYGRMF